MNHYTYIALARGRKMFLKVSWLLFSLTILSIGGYAQDYLHMRMNVSNGLPGNKVYSVCQDSKGYIWLATDRGAVRWNGHEFKRYSIDEGLPDNEVLHVFEDAAQRIWALCYGKKPACIENGVVNMQQVSAMTAGFSSADLYDYSYLNEKKEHWFAFKGDSGLYLIVQPGSNRRYLVQMPADVESFIINDVVELADGSTEFHLPGQLVILRRGARTPEMCKLELPDGLPFEVAHKRLKFSYQGQHYAVSRQGYLVVYNFKDKRSVLRQYTKLPLVARKYFFMDAKPYFYDIHGRVYDVVKGSFVSGYSFLSGKQINELYYDRQGNLWVATLNDGVFLYPSACLPVKTTDLYRDAVTHVYFRGFHVFGTEYNGLYVLDRNFKQLKHYDDMIRTTRLELSGDRCMIAADQGLFYLDAALNLHRVGHMRILKDVHWVGGDTVLVASHRYAFRMKLQPLHIDTLYQGRTTTIWGNRAGQVWIGTLNGVIKMDAVNGKAIRLSDSLLNISRITDITGDHFGRVYIATNHHGLFAWKDGYTHQFTESPLRFNAGAPDRQLNRLFYDGSGLWVLGQSGLSRYRCSNTSMRVEEVLHFGPVHGLNDHILYDISASDTAGIPEVLTDKGLVSVNKLKPAPAVPLFVEIQSISRQDGGELIPVSRWQSIEHYENDLTLHFNAVAVLSGPGLMYEYRLLPSDTQWIQTNVGQVHFMNLKPGSYHFQVRVRVGMNVSKPAVVSFQIKAAWYQHAGVVMSFMLLLSAGLIALIVYLMRRSLRKEQRAVQESRKLAELELKVLRSRMNPHFVFNVLTSIQNFITQGREQEANYYTSQFAQLIRQTFHGSASNFVSLAEELQLLQSYLDLERMRFGNHLEYSIEVDGQLNPEEFSVPSFLMQPFLENAINHGVRNLKQRKGMLFVRLKQHNYDRLLIEIEDNGVGIKATQQQKSRSQKARMHKSEGMQLAKDRIALMNHSYHLNMELKVQDLSEFGGQGTLVLIDLPVQALGEFRNNQAEKE